MGKGGQRERTFHAGLLADFARRAAAHKIVFEESDVKALRETFQRLVIASSPKVPKILDEVRPDGSSEMLGLEEALPWMWIATIDPTMREPAL